MTTAPKKPSYAALLRKIDRLETALQVAHHEQQKARAAYTDTLTELVVLECRVKQAVALLQGEDA
jgi:hypothetical protein